MKFFSASVYLILSACLFAPSSGPNSIGVRVPGAGTMRCSLPRSCVPMQTPPDPPQQISFTPSRYQPAPADGPNPHRAPPSTSKHANCLESRYDRSSPPKGFPPFQQRSVTDLSGRKTNLPATKNWTGHCIPATSPRPHDCRVPLIAMPNTWPAVVRFPPSFPRTAVPSHLHSQIQVAE